MADSDLKPPRLAMPEAEAAWLREVYGRAQVILEYGTGGSTCVAADMPGKTIFSVESDRGWVAEMAAYFERHPPAATLHLHPVDIGPTGKWGAPSSDAGWRRYPDYPVSVWDRDDFLQPDTVLIDGRFRPACLVTAMLRTKAPMTILFDDYANRPRYHLVERWVPVAEQRGRMARFEVRPWALPPQDLANIVALFGQPQ
ncbi:MAG: hypothetical protein AAF748_07680 [Pseudomonadota bacterium]